jgi:predicted regulator of Ras-like GTPase activity (Roadblock/LC7/MglB family)
MLDSNRLAQTVARGNPDVLGVLVVDGDGKVHASESTSPDVVRAAVAMAIPLRDLLDRTAAELGCGELSATIVEGREASFAIADVDGFRSVVVIGATGAAPGALRADSLWIAARLRDGGATS